MAFCVLKWIEKRLKASNLDITPQKAIRKLNKVKSVCITTDKGKMRFRTEVRGEITELFRALGVKIPPVVLSVQES